jgi:anti-anti-sigma factor
MHLLIELAESVLATQPLMIVLDLAHLRFFCADGIRALLHVRDAAAAEAVHLIVRDPSSAVVTVLTITGMLDAFEIKTSHDGG